MTRRRRNWSGLIAVSLGYGCGDEPFASFAARAGAMGGAPVRKCVGIDMDPHNDVSISFESLLHFLGNLQPLFPGRWHLSAIVEKFQERRIVLLFEPIGADRWRRPVLGVGHTRHPANVASYRQKTTLMGRYVLKPLRNILPSRKA